MKDWRIKDNITVAVNYMNKSIVETGSDKKYFDILDAKKMVEKIAKKERVSVLDATYILKNKCRSEYQEVLNEKDKVSLR